MEYKAKEFKPTSWSIDNKTSIYVLAFFIVLFGMISYRNIPKEQFPEIIIPSIIVSTIYPGTSPADMENLVTRPLEKKMKSIKDVKNVSSSSIQDFSSIIVEFQTGIEISEAKQRVRDAVDKTKQDLPSDLLQDPMVMEIDLSEFPIMFINLSGNYPLDKIKEYAEVTQDRIEGMKEITRVDIVGALDREIQIDLDMYKMQAASLTFRDVENMIRYENMTIAGGTVDVQGMRRSIRVVGEFKDIETIKNIVVASSSGAMIYLKDIADIKDSFKDPESYARFNGQNVITLNVVKKSGENLLDAADQINEVMDELKSDKFPSDLKVTISGDQSKYTRTTLKDLNNTIIIGFILVTIVLMFFMGLTNAIFVGFSVPLSMALAYMVLPLFDFTMNMLVMFSFIFALGIVVDDAIVVVENTHRIFNKTKLPIVKAAKLAAGEVFLPILSGTLTTLAPFFPLAFWPGVVGKFMFFIPVTIIITLFMSLIVAYIINPVFAVSYMKHEDLEEHRVARKKVFTYTAIIAAVGLLLHLASATVLANLVLFIAISYMGHQLFGEKVLLKFQKIIIPGMLDKYEKSIRWMLVKGRPAKLLLGLVGLTVLTFIITAITKPPVVFFPDNEPNGIYTYIKMPVGTDIEVTDSVTKMVEDRIVDVLGKDNPIVEGIVANVALSASENEFDFGTVTSNKGKITVNFVEYALRPGISTNEYMEKIREAVKGIPGTEITVGKSEMGPPTGKPVNIEVSGEKIEAIIKSSDELIGFIEQSGIPGIEELKTDFETTKPEIIIDIDRIRANREGISTAQIGMELRTAIYGSEASKYREGEDQYPIQVRYAKHQRESIDRLMNLKITYRDMVTGMLRQIPLSSVATIKYQNAYGGINRKDGKRMITVSSNVITGYNANEIIFELTKIIPKFEKPADVDIKITGEQEDQKETSAFLGNAMIIAICLILLIMITQFNSIGKPLIILMEVFFSLIGVLLGFSLTGMPIAIAMSGMGIVALAGIVVRNGILLVEFTDRLKDQGVRTREAIVQAGKIRITPVVLTATATILGLIPLAIGFNIDFLGLLREFKPHIHFGGDNVMFFGPLSWTIIFGLTFATFLTLIFVPVMYYLMFAFKIWYKRKIVLPIKRTHHKLGNE